MQKNFSLMTALLVISGSVVAEQATDLQPINVYSAYAVAVHQDKTASSVTVLTEKDFSHRDATYVSDVLKTVPGMTFAAYGGRGTLTNFYLRGADANHVAVIIDGIKVNPVTGYGFDFGSLALSNIERIEVLRGEQSALWGSDAMGGVIYITTKSGLYRDKPFNLDFDAGTGSHGTTDGSATVSGYNNGFYYALHGDSHRTRGISAYSADTFRYRTENGGGVTTGGAKERDKFHRDNASLRLGYDTGDKGVELFTSHWTQNSHYDTGYHDTGYDNYTHTRETLLKLSGYSGGEQDLIKQKASVSHIKTDSNSYEAYSASDYHGKRFNADYQLDINFDRTDPITQAVSISGEYQKSEYTANYSDLFYPLYSYALHDKKLTEKSVAAEYRLFTEQDGSFSVSGRFTDSSEFENAFTGRIAGTYRLSPNFKTHASLGSAVQNPTITEYYGYNGRYIANPALKPERSRGGDLGLLAESDDKVHSLDITYFARNVDRAISSEAVGGYMRAVNLEGTSKIRGVEIAYNGKLSDVLTVYANYTFTRAKDAKNIELVRRPKHTANLGLAYRITEQLGANANISYTGKRIDSYYDENTWTSSRVKMPSYTLLNVGVDYQPAENITLYAHLNNLFDKKYEHTVGYGQDGRNVYVGLKGSF